jgi:endogenous inhibitor of DNA gyrase (YacG/DUF329 family)
MARAKPKTDAGGKPSRSVCPTCNEPVDARDLAANKVFPFCSCRCKLIDLGKWFDGEHSFSTPIETEEE